MNTVDKKIVALSRSAAFLAVAIAVVACTNADIEQAAKPMVQPLMAAPIRTSSFNDSGLEPQTVIDVNGNTTAVWEEYDGTRFNIWSKHRVAGQSWGIATLLETDNAGDAYSPHIAVDGIGNITAVWKQSDGKLFSIHANRFVNGKGWEGAKQIETGMTRQVSAEAPLVVYDAAGYAMVAWQQVDGLNAKTWINHHTGDAGWGVAVPFANVAANSTYPRFAFDANGMLAVASQENELPQTIAKNSVKPMLKNNYRQVSSVKQ